jgi:hypothetical protein
MGKWVADQVLDGALAVIAAADRMVALGAQPPTYAAAWENRLAEAPMVTADFVTGPGDASGRKIVIGGKTGANVVAAGTANHVALLDTATGRLLYVTTCPTQMLAPGGTVSFDGWSVEIGAPV